MPPPARLAKAERGLKKIGRGACVGGLGLHALQLSMAAAKVGDEAEECGAVHLIVL